MSQMSFEQVLSAIPTLSPEEMAKLREVVNEPNGKPQNLATSQATSMRDFSDEHQWLAKHRDEYAGQWVALMGNQLISHGPRLKEVRAAAKAAGQADALFVQVERSDAPPFIF